MWMRCWFGSVHSHRFVGVVVFFLGGVVGKRKEPLFSLCGFYFRSLGMLFYKKNSLYKISW